jgi:CHAT domain-containing protein
MQFSRLPGTAGEIATIGQVFGQLVEGQSAALETLRGEGATEAAFRNAAPQHAILHLATHGFFADPSKKSAVSGESRQELAYAQEQDDLIRGFNPQLLSGLALSGANRPPQPDHDDGILTAAEIAALPLENVDLVVLSACETGLGEVAGGEGLLGVQRAFQISGARTTIASLWQVDDAATRLLMERFYRNRWQEKMTKLDALREAQLWMLTHPAEVRAGGADEDRGDRRRTTNPVDERAANRLSPQFWAAFQLSGDWR